LKIIKLGEIGTPDNTEFLLEYHIESNNIRWQNINLAQDVIKPYNIVLT